MLDRVNTNSQGVRFRENLDRIKRELLCWQAERNLDQAPENNCEEKDSIINASEVVPVQSDPENIQEA